jgi:hypothetical protein
MTMNPERWGQVKTLFHAALAHTVPERGAFVQAQCGADAEMLREVTALLKGHRPSDAESYAESGTETAEGGTSGTKMAALEEDPVRMLRERQERAQELLRQQLAAELAGNFELGAVLGHGGSGVVFQARDVGLDRRVAIKCLYPSAAQRAGEKTLQEARHLAKISHPNIAAVYAVSQRAALPYLVMEFIDGVPITEAVADWPLEKQVGAFKQVLGAVAELHRRGVVHRDLKPANVLVDQRGHVKLVDFGIACPADSHAESLAGTPSYMAPEQCRRQEVRPSADVFSLGVLLFEMLTGQRPFGGGNIAEVQAAMAKDSPPLPRELRPDIPGALQAICLLALETDAKLRYPTAREFLLDLERWEHGQAVAANPTVLAAMLDHGIDRHLADLTRWAGDRSISERDLDYFESGYDHLRQREEFWVLDSRRLTYSQVILHLGAWTCALAALLLLVEATGALGMRRPLLPGMTFGVLLALGVISWRRHSRRIAVAILLAAALAGPLALGTALVHFGWLQTPPSKTFDLLPPGPLKASDAPPAPILDNQQFLAVAVLFFVLSLGMWRWTKTAAFALLGGISAITLFTAIYAVEGMNAWHDGAKVAGRYLWPGAMLFGTAMFFDLRRRFGTYAPPLYILGMSCLLLCLTVIARYGPTTVWLGFTALRDDTYVRYSFMGNGVLYLIAGYFADRSRQSARLRRIGTILFWIAPSNILAALAAEAIDRSTLTNRYAWTPAEVLLPVVAIAFVIGSVPRQTKAFFFSGVAYLACGIVLLTDHHFPDNFVWPLVMVCAGLVLVGVSWRYPSLWQKKQTT